MGRCYPPSSGQGSVCRRGQCCGAGRTWRCWGDAGDSQQLQVSSSLTPLLSGILWDRFWILRGAGHVADVPSSVQELWPCLCHMSPSCQDSLPWAGSRRRGAAQGCVRPAMAWACVGFAPAGSYAWGIPLAESSAAWLATAQLGFGAFCHAASPSSGLPMSCPCTDPPAAACPPVHPRSSRDRAQGDTEGGTRGSGSSC